MPAYSPSGVSSPPWHPPAGTACRRRALCAGRARDGAASPVVGFVLVLGIALTAMTLVFIWGVPTLDSVQSSQTAASADREFVSLSGEIESLLAGAPVATTPTWSPTLSRGTVNVHPDGRVWAAGVNTGTDLDLVWGNITDGDNTFAFRNVGGSSVDLRISAVSYEGLDSTALYLTINGAGCATAPTMSSLAAASAPQTITVHTGATCDATDARTLADGEFLFTFTETTDDVDSFLGVVDAGRVAWDLSTAEIHYREEFTNGAVLSGTGGQWAIMKAPALGPPRAIGTSTADWFIRFLRVDKYGGTGFAGEGSPSFFLKNNGTYVRTSQSDAQNVHIHPPADQFTAWSNHFTATDTEFYCDPMDKGTSKDQPFTLETDAMMTTSYVLANCGSVGTFSVSLAYTTITIQQGGQI